MTGSHFWLPVILIEEDYAHPTNWTRDPSHDTFHLRGLSVQIKR
jgi:hypothetical protein